jgi:hypothetical protein
MDGAYAGDDTRDQVLLHSDQQPEQNGQHDAVHGRNQEGKPQTVSNRRQKLSEHLVPPVWFTELKAAACLCRPINARAP